MSAASIVNCAIVLQSCAVGGRVCALVLKTRDASFNFRRLQRLEHARRDFSFTAYCTLHLSIADCAQNRIVWSRREDYPGLIRASHRL